MLDVILNTEGQSVTLVYVDSTQGWVNVQDNETQTGSTFIIATGGTITTCVLVVILKFIHLQDQELFVFQSMVTTAANNVVSFDSNWRWWWRWWRLIGGGGGGAGGFREIVNL